jgi:hypothetical protein
MVVAPAQEEGGRFGGRVEFVAGHDQREAVFLSLSFSFDQSTRAARLDVAGDGSEITLVVREVTPAGGHGGVTGHFGGKPFEWEGPVASGGSAQKTLGRANGFRRDAFKAGFERASYFEPARARIAHERHDRAQAHSRGSQVEAAEGAPEAFYRKAGFLGLVGLNAAVTTGGTGGMDLLVACTMLLGLGNEGADSGPGSEGGPVDGGDGGDGIQSPDDPNSGGDGGEDTSPGSGCFAAGTLVATAGGRPRPIEELCVDDVVVSRDETTGIDGERRVHKVWRHEQRPTVELGLANGETIRTTSVHRVFTVEHGLVGVSALRVGDHLETLAAGPQQIRSITPGAIPATVYNLNVEGYHTYFVGETGAWVHNAKDDKDPIQQGSDVGDKP